MGIYPIFVPVPTITLTTDFGLTDPYVGVMKGVIAGICPEATVIDISHAVPPQDVPSGARMLSVAWKFFPAGTVHVAVVDPGVGSDRPILASSFAGHLFLAPDNGLLDAVLAEAPDALGHCVQERSFFRPEISNTFHGRDIFAPVAAHLASGRASIESLGPPVSRDAWTRLALPVPSTRGDGAILGRIVAVDHFGNLITNIPAHCVADWANAIIALEGAVIRGTVDTYANAPLGATIALVGSSGHLEISVVSGSAAVNLGAGRGAEVVVKT